jgi:hypothetical protein
VRRGAVLANAATCDPRPNRRALLVGDNRGVPDAIAGRALMGSLVNGRPLDHGLPGCSEQQRAQSNSLPPSRCGQRSRQRCGSPDDCINLHFSCSNRPAAERRRARRSANAIVRRDADRPAPKRRLVAEALARSDSGRQSNAIVRTPPLGDALFAECRADSRGAGTRVRAFASAWRDRAIRKPRFPLQAKQLPERRSRRLRSATRAKTWPGSPCSQRRGVALPAPLLASRPSLEIDRFGNRPVLSSGLTR